MWHEGKQGLLQGEVTESVFAVLREAVAAPGQPVQIPPNLAMRLEREAAVAGSAEILNIRRRERTINPDMLALHLG